MKQVFVQPDGLIVAVHDQGQDVPLSAYSGSWPDVARVCVPDDETPFPITPDGKAARLPDDWRTRYPEPVPAEIDSTDGKLTLLDNGLLDDFEAAIEAMDAADKRAAQIVFNGARWRRSNDLWAAIGAGLEPALSSGDIDDLFREAAAR